MSSRDIFTRVTDILLQNGWELVRRETGGRGGHFKFTKEGCTRPFIVSHHAKDKNMMNSQLRKAGIEARL